jgi:hypothetical protein
MEKENIIYVVEVEDKTDAWVPIYSSMNEQKAIDVKKQWLDSGQEVNKIRITESLFKFKGVYNQG